VGRGDQTLVITVTRRDGTGILEGRAVCRAAALG